MLKLLFSFITLLSIQSFVIADIKQIKNSDGTVEFSNISKSKSTQKQTLIYKYPQSGNITVFTDQKPTHISNYEVIRFDCFACNPNSTINWNKVKLNLTSFVDTVNRAAQRHNVDPALVRAVIHAESAFNVKAISHAGAQGLMQLMPATAKELGVTNSLNAKQNINGGAKYIAQLLHTFNGDIKLATAAYNAGPNAVKKYHGIPPYQETEVYVERVGILHRRYQSAI